MGKKGRVKELKKAVRAEIKFQKAVMGDLADQQMNWTQSLTLGEMVHVLNAEKSLNQMLILLLFSFYVPILQPWVSISMAIFVAAQLWVVVKLLRSIRASKKAEGL